MNRQYGEEKKCDDRTNGRTTGSTDGNTDTNTNRDAEVTHKKHHQVVNNKESFHTMSKTYSDESKGNVDTVDITKQEQQQQQQPQQKESQPIDERRKKIISFTRQKDNNAAKHRFSVKMICFTLLGIVLQTIIFDIPVLSMYTIQISTQMLLDISHTYLFKQVELQIFDSSEKAEHDITYYHRTCTISDQTANDTIPLLITQQDDHDDVVYKMLKHGVVVFPDLLLQSTATALRNFILHENNVSKELLYVIKNKNRWSFPIRVDQHPTVTKTLHELLNNNTQLIHSLELLMGKNPAIIEFTAITAAYGATEQHWHQDVVPETSGAKYSRTFIPSYSLFIPLQNTTGRMGATGICPGTHMCAAGPSKFCSTSGFQVSGYNDNWPMGYGALVNQQTTHRGEAHTDPDADHRVVFILTFAPRPVVTSSESTSLLHRYVESKLIGQAGSYSLHWSHWGHTLYDYQNINKRMAFWPLRLLRTLGMYTMYGDSSWGWDYITVSSGRIAAWDTGFSNGDLEEFVTTKGGLTFVPQSLQGNLTSTYAEYNTPNDNPWIAYLMDTMVRCKMASQSLHQKLLILYFILVISWNILFPQKQNTTDTLVAIIWTFLRVLVLHGIIIVVSQNIMNRVNHSTWARNILTGHSYTLPRNKLSSLTPSPNDFPETLPNANDILIIDNMKSHYMASYNDVIDVVHPGNQKWNRLVTQNAFGYSQLSPSIQYQIRTSLISWINKEFRSRILLQNSISNWAVVATDNQLADWFCHKSLIMNDAALTYNYPLLQEIDFIKSELKFGYLRQTAMSKYHISTFISTLEDTILNLSKKRKRDYTAPTAGKKMTSDPLLVQQRQQLLFRKHLSLRIPTTKDPKNGNRRIQQQRRLQQRLLIPSMHLLVTSLTEPFDGAWIQTGDIVEAAYDGDKTEWYAAKVLSASANKYTWTVKYSDGEIDDALCATCVRRFIPYAVGEAIETRLYLHDNKVIDYDRIDEDADEIDVAYFPGVVTYANVAENRYAVKLLDGTLRLDVRVEDIRRHYSIRNKLDVLTRVDTRYPNEDDWFSGYIAKVNVDGSTFGVQYDDGEFLPNVHYSEIRLEKNTEDDK